MRFKRTSGVWPTASRMLLQRILFSYVAPIGKINRQICHTFRSLTCGCDSTHVYGMKCRSREYGCNEPREPSSIVLLFRLLMAAGGLFREANEQVGGIGQVLSARDTVRRWG